MASRFSISAHFKAIDEFSAPLRKMSNGIDRVVNRARKGIESLNAANDKIASGIRAAAAGVAAAGAAVGVGVASVVKSGMEFEQAITNVGAVSLMTRDQIADLEKKALELGATTQFSATEVANGMEMMGKAGFENEDILRGIGGILAAAAAEGAGLAETAENISSVMKGMGLATSESSRVADVLTLAAARTNSSISSLGESMKNLGPVARQFGIGLEPAVAMAALLQDVGLDASQAGTNLASAFTKLAKPSKEAQRQMRKLGVTFEDASGNMLPPVKVFENLAIAAQKSGGNMDQAAFFAELFGLESQKAALNLTNMFKSGEAKKLIEALDGAKGKAEEMAALRMKTLRGDFEQLGGAIETVSISLFNMQGGPLRKIVQRMTEWVSSNQALITSKVESFVAMIATNLDRIVLAAKRVLAAVVVFYVWRAAVVAATVATWGLQAVSVALGVATRILSVVSRAGAAAMWLGTAATWAKIAALGVYNGLVWIGTAALTAFRGVTTLTTLATWAITGASYAFAAIFAVRNALTVAGTAVLAAFGIGQQVSTARTVALTAATWLATAATTAWNAVMAINPAVLVGIAVVALIGYLIKVSGLWDTVKNAVVGFGQSALAVIQPVIDKVSEFIGMVRGAANAIGGFLGMGGGPELATGGDMSAALGVGATPEVVSPQDHVAKSVTESTNVQRAEVTVKPAKGTSATMTKGPRNFPLQVQPSGAF